MAKVLTIKEGSSLPAFSGVNRLRTDGEGGRVYWVPRDERPLETLFVMENGTYTANEYGISDVTVSVMSNEMGKVDLDFDGMEEITIGDLGFKVSGIDPIDGGLLNIELDSLGNLVFSDIPYSAEAIEKQESSSTAYFVKLKGRTVFSAVHSHSANENYPLSGFSYHGAVVIAECFEQAFTSYKYWSRCPIYGGEVEELEYWIVPEYGFYMPQAHFTEEITEETIPRQGSNPSVRITDPQRYLNVRHYLITNGLMYGRNDWSRLSPMPSLSEHQEYYDVTPNTHCAVVRQNSLTVYDAPQTGYLQTDMKIFINFTPFRACSEMNVYNPDIEQNYLYLGKQRISYNNAIQSFINGYHRLKFTTRTTGPRLGWTKYSIRIHNTPYDTEQYAAFISSDGIIYFDNSNTLSEWLDYDVVQYSGGYHVKKAKAPIQGVLIQFFPPQELYVSVFSETTRYETYTQKVDCRNYVDGSFPIEQASAQQVKVGIENIVTVPLRFDEIEKMGKVEEEPIDSFVL